MPGRGVVVEQCGTRAAVRLKVTGELDVSTVPGLEEGVRELRGKQVLVEMDLSELDVIDVAGARAVARALAAAQPEELLSLKPAPSRQAQRLFDLVGLDRLVAAA